MCVVCKLTQFARQLPACVRARSSTALVPPSVVVVAVVSVAVAARMCDRTKEHPQPAARRGCANESIVGHPSCRTPLHYVRAHASNARTATMRRESLLVRCLCAPGAQTITQRHCEKTKPRCRVAPAFDQPSAARSRSEVLDIVS